MTVKTYSPKDISIVVAGATISGYAEGTFCNIERSADAFTKVVGAGGEVTRTASADRSGTITITLLQTSSSNDILSSLQQADELSLTGKFPVLIKDNFGNSLHEASTAWIMKVADAEYAAEMGSREWTIECSDLISFVGSNNS